MRFLPVTILSFLIFGTPALAHELKLEERDVIEDPTGLVERPPKEFNQDATNAEIYLFSGIDRRTLVLPAPRSKHKDPVNCSKSSVTCREICFSIPSAPKRYTAVLDGREEIHYNPRREYFSTNFGGYWATLEETFYKQQSNGYYRICFLGKNWRRHHERRISIEVRY